MPNITRESHYVPQAVLRRWSDDGTRVHAYRFLVSHVEVPEWEPRSIRSAARQSDLYTGFDGQGEIDDFEKSIAREYENPGLEAVNKLLSRVRLSPLDWRRIAKLLAAQDLRTPLSFVEAMQRWERHIPESLEESVHDAADQIKRAKASGVALIPSPKTGHNPFQDSLRVHIEWPTEPGSDQAIVRAEVKSGRSLWIDSIRHLLAGAANTLCTHRWSVAEPHGNEEWPLTDHPVLRLNYNGPDQYDFGGGWGHKGSELMMPMSPRHLLYVQVGKRAASRFAFSKENTQLVQRLLVERAYRSVFMRQPTAWVATCRPRTIDRAAFLAEQEAWSRWHSEQIASETQYHAGAKALAIE